MTIAIDRNKLDWVKLLTERGVDLHNSLSLAYKATEVLNMEGVYKFFARNGIIDRNYTPLMWAARRSRPEIAEYLVLQGSDVMAISNEEMNALDYANDVATRSAIRSAQSKLRAQAAGKKNRNLVQRANPFFSNCFTEKKVFDLKKRETRVILRFLTMLNAKNIHKQEV